MTDRPKSDRFGDISIGPICLPVPQPVLDIANAADAPVKAFLCTSVGKIVSFGIASALTGGLSNIVGPQLATVAFAVPGVLEGQSFPKAWLDAFNERLAMLPGALAAAGGGPATPAAPDVQKLIGDQVAQATKWLAQLPPGTLQMSAAQLAQALGIRQDAAQYALDLFNHTAPNTAGSIYDSSVTYNPVSGEKVMAGTQKVTGVTQATGLMQQLQAQRGVVGRAGQQFISQGSAQGLVPGVHTPSPTPAVPTAPSVAVPVVIGGAIGGAAALAMGAALPIAGIGLALGMGLGWFLGKKK